MRTDDETDCCLEGRGEPVAAEATAAVTSAETARTMRDLRSTTRLEGSLASVRLALVSDQHGNQVAFRAVVEDLGRIGVDEVVCLGDVVQGGVEPAETLERLRALGCETVLGNADAFLLEVPQDSPEPVTERQLEVREWTLSQLSPAQLEQIRTFAPVVRPQTDSVALLLFHGSPSSYDDVLLPELGDEALAPFLGHDADLLAGGHTHLQWSRRIEDGLYVNPGSVGISYDRNADPLVLRPLAEWALVTVENGTVGVEFRQVPYSADDVRSAAAASGRPYADEWAAQWA
jgi:putative phosphoesterase